MRCCWLLALGLVIDPIGLRGVAAEEPTATASLKTDSPQVDGGDGNQATLSALSTAVKMPPLRRRAMKTAATTAGATVPVVHLAMPSPYAAPESADNEKSLDGLANRLVSHSEAVPEPVVIISDEAPESNQSTVRPVAVWTPTDVGDVDDDSKAPVTSLKVLTPTDDSQAPVTSQKVSAATGGSSRAPGCGAVNPLRQAPTSTISSRDLANPLR